MTAQIIQNIKIDDNLERAVNNLLRKIVAIAPKTVLWSEIPIEEESLQLLITFVGPAVNIPYRYYKDYKDGRIMYRLIGEVVDRSQWNHGRTFEFWTVLNCSEIEVVKSNLSIIN